MQKTILERKGPPTFTCAVEMISRTECRVHHRLDATVDAILAGVSLKYPFYLIFKKFYKIKSHHNLFWVTGKTPLFEIRQMDTRSDDSLKTAQIHGNELVEEYEAKSIGTGNGDEVESDEENENYALDHFEKPKTGGYVRRSSPVCVYTYKVNWLNLLSGTINSLYILCSRLFTEICNLSCVI